MKKAVTAGSLLFFTAFFLLPLGYFYLQALEADGGAGFASRAPGILGSAVTWRIVSFSVLQAAASALFCVVLALPGAYYASRYEYPLKKLFRSASLIPFVLPSIIVVLAMISFYGKNGVINRLFGLDLNLIYNPAGIILAHGFYNVSLALRIMTDGMAGADGRLREIAASLGDGPARRFFRVILPLTLPSAVTAFVIIFLYCFLSFGIVLIFGGVSHGTLEVKIYTEMYTRLDLPSAALHSLLQMALAASFLAFAGGIIRQFQFRRARAPRLTTTSLSGEPFAKRLAVFAYFLLLALFLFGPLVSLTVRALRPNGVWSFASFASLFRPELSSRDIEGIIRSGIPAVITRSILLALGTGAVVFSLALALGLSLRGKKSALLDGFFYLPAGMSMVSLGIGTRLLYDGIIPDILLVVFTQVFLAFPFVFRIMRTTVEDYHDRYTETAASLGANRKRVILEVQIPVMRRGLLNAFAYSVAIPFTDFTAVMTVGRGEITTFPVAIYRLIGFRSFDLGLALGVIYILICLAVFFWIDGTSLTSGAQHDTTGRN